ncbi:MAG: hypothetical protein QNI99_00025 [Woeseiaceae bacterium]|nr:hypothetical protein [Woeseiaceae bacterium]
MPEANASVDAELRRASSITTSGCALRADAEQIAAIDTRLARVTMEVAEIAASGQPVAIRLDGIDRNNTPAAVGACLRRLADALDRHGIDRSNIELTVSALLPDIETVHDLCIAEFGARRLNLVVGDLDEAGALNWEPLALIGSRGRALIGGWPSISSRSALLRAEAAPDVLPGHGLQAPAQSAWLMADLDFATAWETGNSLSEDAIQDILAAVFDAAEALHEPARWPTASMGHDAWFNRRMSIRLVGIGDWVRNQGLDPERHDTLTFLDRIVRTVARTFEQASRRRTSEPLPAVLAEDPGRLMGKGAQRDAWSRRWREAVHRCGMRHRNLLTMSPWALFPRENADFRYANLLPLLCHGDACSFAREVAIDGWNANEFRDFHLRILALARHRYARDGIATSL